MPLLLQRPAEGEHVPYYSKYISLVQDGDLIETLARNADDTLAFVRAQPPEFADHAYAAGKWTVKQVLGHLCDAERIFSYRLLRIARGDGTPMEGFDENSYTPAGQFTDRTLESLLEEFAAIRASTIALVAGLPDEGWSCSGIANGDPISARAIAYIIAGHELHHREMLLTRYASASAV